jgi:hypothetical protein
MTAYGDFKVHTLTIPSATTSSNEVDLGGAGHEHVYLQIPASPSGDARPMVARALDGTYVRIGDQTATLKNIASSVSNCMVRLMDHGRFMKVTVTTAAANGATYYIVCYS